MGGHPHKIAPSVGAGVHHIPTGIILLHGRKGARGCAPIPCGAEDTGVVDKPP